MANSNTIYKAPAAAALAGATITTTETIFAKSSDATTAAQVQLPGGSKLDGKPIRLVATGKFTAGTTTNLTIKLFAGSSLTVASNTSIATSGAIAVNTAGTKCNFRLEFAGVADSTSNTLQGIFYGHVNGTSVAQTIHSAAVTVDPSANTSYPFVVSATCSASSAGNAVTLTDFSLQQD
jgi:hypothetical protein